MDPSFADHVGGGLLAVVLIALAVAAVFSASWIIVRLVWPEAVAAETDEETSARIAREWRSYYARPEGA